MTEIITLQLGSYANYVGSHYWNIQDEAIGCSEGPDWATLAPTLRSEVVCAWSEDRYGDTSYAPRTVVLDLSGSLGGVSFSRTEAASAAQAGAASAQSLSLWGGGMQVQHAPSIAKSRYRQQLEDAGALDPDVELDPEQLDAQQHALEAAAAELHAAQTTPRYWTDFLQVDLADSCVLTLSGAWQGQAGWDGWGVGGSSSGSAVRELVDAAVDRVRWWAEQCDRMQGLQLLADDLGGWGGICHDVVQQLRDQYPSQPMLYFSLRNQMQQQGQGQQAAANGGSGGSFGASSPAHTRWQLSSSLSLCEIPQLASLYVPLDASSHAFSAAMGPHSSSSSNRFSTAALLAAAIDTVTLPLRCTDSRSALGAAAGATDMHSLIHLLSGQAANLAAASLQLPAGSLPPSNLTSSSGSSGGSSSSPEALLSLSGSSSSSSSSCLTLGVRLTADNCLAESVTLRGARTSPSAALCTVTHAKQALDSLLFQRQQQAVSCRCVVHSCVSPMPLAAPLSFPRTLLPAPTTPQRTTAQGLTPSGGMLLNPNAAAGGATTEGGGVPNPYLPRSAKSPAVPAPGVFSRLTSTSAFEPLLQGAARDLQRLGVGAAGRACLGDWGYSSSDLQELQEGLLGMAGRYSADDE